MEVVEHQHPLKLFDWQLEFPHKEEEEEEEEEEEGGDPITKQGFPGACDRCNEEIHMYHRYYYKCMTNSSCHFSLHKFCAELQSRLEHSLHNHSLSLLTRFSYLDTLPSYYYECHICKRYIKNREVCYICSAGCHFYINVKCGVQVDKKTIHHPSHKHLLTCVASKPILCECSACGKRHEGMFYQCTMCASFTIHNDCAFLPKTLLIQHATDDAFCHRHPLTLSYSFPRDEQIAKHHPRCRVCGDRFYERWYLWIYKCEKCLYYAHGDCATSRKEPFMSIFLAPRKNIKNFEDADHPRLLRLPFLDETYSIPKHLFFQRTITGSDDHKVNLKHTSHEHPLVLVDIGQTSNNINSSLLLMCHDPMKKTKLLCNGCLKPIMSTMPFYKCNQSCNFALHEWCTRLPTEVENHLVHPQHALVLIYSNARPFFFDVFYCRLCDRPCNGFAYYCVQCRYIVDVTCGFIPQKITHEAHPNHLLSLVGARSNKDCHMCHKDFGKGRILFRCNTCDIYIHLECALLLTKEIRHKYDKHPMHLSYLPIENHKSEYFCEICEEDLDPHVSFYHCHDCVQSVHTGCAPSILQSETVTKRFGHRTIHKFVNIKFGGIYNTEGHPHPLSFAQGVVLDGECGVCDAFLDYEMILKCLECKFAIHSKCCDRLINKI